MVHHQRISYFVAIIVAILSALVITSSASAATATLSWDPPSNNADGSVLTDLAGYKIYYGTASGNYSQTINAGNVTFYNLNGLNDGTKYFFSVTAYDTSGNESSFSNEVSKTTATADTVQPVLTGVSVTNITTTNATIIWFSDEPSTSQVEYGSTASYGSVTALDTNLLTAHTVILTGLTPNTSYHFNVRSADSSNNLRISGDVTFLTLAVPDITPPADVQNFTATPGDKEVVLSWVNPTDQDFAGVRIRYRTDGQYPADSNDGTLLGDFTGSTGESRTTVHGGAQNDITFYYSAFSYDSVGNFTHTVHAIATPTAANTNGSSTGNGNTGGGNAGGGSTGGGGCFIATAAYGSYLDPHVMVLRGFRDHYLLTNSPGKSFVAFYYNVSPPVADFIRRHDSLRTATRFLLTPIIYGIEYPIISVILFSMVGGACYGICKIPYAGRGSNDVITRMWRRRRRGYHAE